MKNVNLMRSCKQWIKPFLWILIVTAVCLGMSFAETQKTVVSFMDVGQADSILIQTEGKVVLIDAGNRDDSKELIQFLKQKKIKKLDVFIGTHPHEDHIGGAADILKEFGASKVYMPKVMATTKTFENLLKTIKSKQMTITAPKVGDKIIEGKGVALQIIAPYGSKYEETNEYSIVTKLTVGKKSFLFTGDAEAVSEKEMMGGSLSLKADVLKVGHHGGRTSTSTAFLNKVNPSYAIISVGNDNSYNHPHDETVKRLYKQKVYQTSLHGTITFTTDGNTLSFVTEKQPQKSAAVSTVGSNTNVASKVAVFVTNTGEKYHLEGCSGLSRSKIPIEINDAKSKGYSACGLCRPPK